MEKNEIIKTINRVLARHPYVVRAELFGSLARGEARQGSDIDLLVEYDDTRPRGFRAFGIFGDLEDALGLNVDIVQEKLLHGFIKRSILRDRELIYERQKLS